MLYEKVVGPLFQAQGWETEWVHGSPEVGHKLDVLLVAEERTGSRVRGIQLKRGKDLRTERQAQEVWNCALRAFRYSHAVAARLVPLEHFYWITTGRYDGKG